MEAEIAENENLMEELTKQLKTLEEQAGEIMKTCQEAEASHCVHLQAYAVQYILNRVG